MNPIAITQKFHKNDLVRVANNLGPTMSHFAADCDAIIIGSYADRFGGSSRDVYTIAILPGYHETSWYYENQLTLIRRLSGQEVLAIKDAADKQKALESTIPWIVSNWKQMKESGNFSGSSVSALMREIGIENPWGSHGEGITYYTNAYRTISILEDVLMTGDINLVMERILKIKSIMDQHKIRTLA